jgi:hypothetical protein
MVLITPLAPISTRSQLGLMCGLYSGQDSLMATEHSRTEEPKQVCGSNSATTYFSILPVVGSRRGLIPHLWLDTIATLEVTKRDPA